MGRGHHARRPVAERAAHATPEADAVVFVEERWTYAQAAERARTFARGLIGLGVGPGDRVGVLMANSPDAIAAIFAIALAGATVVPINTRYRAVELPFVVADAGVRVIVTSDRIDEYVDLLGLLDEALRRPAPRRPRDLEHDRGARHHDPRRARSARRTSSRWPRRSTRPSSSSAAAPCACATTRCCSTRRGTTSLPRGCRLTPRGDRAQLDARRRRSCASAPATACGRRARSSTSARSAR